MPPRHRLRLWVGLCALVLSACSPTTDETDDAQTSVSASQTSAETGSDLEPATTTSTTAPTTSTIPHNQPARFVDPVNGRDGATGEYDDPFRTPREAMGVLQPGDTLYFREGVYDDRESNFNIGTVVGAPDAWITITPFPTEEVLIVPGGEWGNGFEMRGSKYVIIEGFRMVARDDSEHGAGVRIKEESHDIIVRHNYMENFGAAGVSATQSSRITMEYNEVRNTAKRSYFQGSGLSIYEPIGPDNQGDEFANIIRGNLVVGTNTEVRHPDTDRITDGNCIIIDLFSLSNYPGSTLVENNTCIDNGGRGIHVFGSSFVTVRNNTLVRNGWNTDLFGFRGELTVSDAIDVVFANNVVINSEDVSPFLVGDDTENVQWVNNAFLFGELPPGDSNFLLDGPDVLLSLDPAGVFGDHRPTADSPLIAASDTATQAPSDGSGAQRPATGSIGAWEP